MATPKRDNELAAKALVEALFTNDAQACAKHGIARRTLQNYRKLLASDEELARAFAEHLAVTQEVEKQQTRRSWAEEMDSALREIVKEALALWRDLKAEAVDFSQRMQVLQASLQFISQLSEPQMVREVLGVGSADAAQGAAVPAAAEDRSGETTSLN